MGSFRTARWLLTLSLTFLLFDIVDFYPSITQDLLTTCLGWAKNFTEIKDIEIDTIMHARRTLLFDNDNTTWVKRGAEHQFDVSMGAYDGAEVCKLVGLYALSLLKNRLSACSVGLYMVWWTRYVKKALRQQGRQGKESFWNVLELGLSFCRTTPIDPVELTSDPSHNVST